MSVAEILFWSAIAGANLVLISEGVRLWIKNRDEGAWISLRCRFRKCDDFAMVETYSEERRRRNYIETGKGVVLGPAFTEVLMEGKARCVRCGRLYVARFGRREWK